MLCHFLLRYWVHLFEFLTKLFAANQMKPLNKFSRIIENILLRPKTTVANFPRTEL